MLFNSVMAMCNLLAMMNPNTGDARNPVLFVVIGVIAAVLIALTIVLSNVSKKNKK